MRLLLLLAVAVAVTCVAASKLRIEIHTESLCPSCISFYSNSLKNALNTPGFENMADLNIFPYGNAKQRKLNSNWVFTCQHGDKECEGNLMEVCAIELMNHHDRVRFVQCVEENEVKTGGFIKTGKNCAKDLDFDFGVIQTCMDGAEGNNLQH